MDWNRTKTIFIVTFLMLNSFLVYQLMEQRADYQTNVQAETTVQETLEENNITLETEWPEEISEGQHIVKSSFSVPEDAIENLNEDDEYVVDEDTINVSLNEPFELPPEDITDELTEFIEEYVVGGDYFRYGYWDSDARQFVFYQTYEDQTIYTYEAHALVLFIDEEGNIDSFAQSFSDVEAGGRTQDFISPPLALENLLNEGVLMYNDDITQMDLGFHNPFGNEETVRAFAPMYLIEINGEEMYLVHAIEGNIVDLTEEDS
ncbi:two-component system regulatory protein YycI [Salsuginibacillus kocurii]|uniref:two-component system regulatory protein YycI n=1 Tax=Salsuginibacillus kocurii TaxID=427078 RepID=UPI0003747876|nr:two-component system regulatory protein YycI [Salsuginibacillus kocurii]